MGVRRIYVEKKKAYAVRAVELFENIKTYLGISDIAGVRVLVRYDIENLDDKTFSEARGTIFSEPPLDELYEETFPKEAGDTVFSAEYLPGQFDQRADSAVQCVQLIDKDAAPVIRTATTYVLSGKLSAREIEAVKHFCINPVDSRECAEEKPETLTQNYPAPDDVKTVEGFTAMPEDDFRALYASFGLAMTYEDFLEIRHYFESEKRNPTVTEIRVLDTYWSDHCRHTTFQTELTRVSFLDGDFRERLTKTYERYRRDHEDLLGGRSDKFICLMDLALMGMRRLKKDGKLTDQEETDEINACSVVVPITVDGKEEEWLVNFKNETHNHPTEIEPFGGAATCLGGAIRDPLSGRTYVYQAMRITGAADPTRPLGETLPGKLPQRKIVREAAHGYSSYGNQVGLATGYVKEIYHPDYVAKRMELGAVMAAAPKKNVVRMSSDPGDVIVLLGGRTGRDGIGGATGSSKIHTTASIESCGAEVQKGNAPTERKIQHMFRRPEVSLLIKKCNDFGAGGVAVAIGELAPGLTMDLDKVPLKYAGLDGTEIAISESQERMACVLDPKDVDAFLRYAEEENLEATPVAVVTAEPRLVLNWRGKAIVDLSRIFLDTNGAHLTAEVEVELPKRSENPFGYAAGESVRDKWLNALGDLNACSQKGLVEMFDASIGAGTVTMPYGGKYQLTETQSMIAKIPLLKGHTDAATVMSYGFDPYLSSWSPYHGAVYAVCDSVAKVAAVGGDIDKIHLTFQEFFRRMDDNKPERWSQPFAALLGAYEAQLELGLASIGGKDSMSGTFNEIDVPPTLVSFAVDVASVKDIITPELKVAGNRLVLLTVKRDGDLLPDYADLKAQYRALTEDIKAKRVLSAYVLERHGAAEAVTKMGLGNGLGVKLADNVSEETLFAPGWCNLLLEVPAEALGKLSCRTELFGEVTATPVLSYRGTEISLAEAEKAWTGTLEEVFPTRVTEGGEILDRPLYHAASVAVCGHKIGTPRVFIPVFPGTNCEYDSARAFEEVGAVTSAPIFRNQNAEDIAASVEAYRNEIRNAQIVMFPGGFSAGDEPDGSAKFFAQVFRNEVVKEELLKLLNERDGLVLGICNGFQALIKLGLLPDANIKEQAPDAPTLAMNRIGRHLSRVVNLKVVSDKSPWLRKAELSGVYANVISHGEGRFVAPQETIEALFRAGQVATQYCDLEGRVSTDELWTPNGSYAAIEGITSQDGRIYGKMAHPERIGEHINKNIPLRQDLGIFAAGVAYFRG
ncbi:phosphoribosylformylglycinamidine synthase [Stomatobaculum longum]|uniref:Phosphoribosylformylglycinamidine synthase n=1 Tax=Stomatobaculum longum TaxID=796942 RepID=A0AA37DH19_9FIRM|nr:phosphoribosylformylglycinamidine synthase [Stomatobaculum longum]EHO17695.1 phosphoribosylformylglycinamidine synthase [Stomatobaculum longum]